MPTRNRSAPVAVSPPSVSKNRPPPLPGDLTVWLCQWLPAAGRPPTVCPPSSNRQVIAPPQPTSGPQGPPKGPLRPFATVGPARLFSAGPPSVSFPFDSLSFPTSPSFTCRACRQDWPHVTATTDGASRFIAATTDVQASSPSFNKCFRVLLDVLFRPLGPVSGCGRVTQPLSSSRRWPPTHGPRGLASCDNVPAEQTGYHSAVCPPAPANRKIGRYFSSGANTSRGWWSNPLPWRGA